MIKLKEAIVVEGRYDKNKLKQIFDATIIDTNGFGIFKDEALTELLRRLAVTRGIIVLTDSDGAGFVIRNHIKSVVQEGKIYHAYIPDMCGKERRKLKPGKEGKLGVEGVPDAAIIEAVRRCGVLDGPQPVQDGRKITSGDFFRLGLSGGPESKKQRAKLVAYLALPEHTSAKALLEITNALITLEELERLMMRL